MLFRGDDIYVTSGVNLDDGLGVPDQVCPGDTYELAEGAQPLRLMVARSAGAQTVAPGSEIGAQGDPVQLVARYTLMGEDGNAVELMLLRLPGGLYALPLSPMGAGIGYALVKVDDSPAEAPLADLLCLAFVRGTRITLAGGAQVAIEALQPGDRVLTRDHGGQPLRWLGRATLRGVGAFAPVVIGKGVLGNEGDLIVSQHHRMFLYQRDRSPGLPTAELLVQARHLVNGETIYIRDGGFVDYFSLVFDRHEIIYAEGIPAESLMVNEATLARLPAELAAEVQARFPGLAQPQHFGTEAGGQALAHIAATRRPKA
ncbi:Hint domain-containing protein [Rhodobacter ferrooxidans]|uniref:Hedgehog/Intein (Hint) domain-containing protein n=1 Tax=Rhodobacter ferrooxidans TaxID=371731 RepID=C8RY96_9RHOB|nr:Hint domain-containing protein [Rhodobacter sp. SW2]EEW26494.1 conserved hypothetical protein [Rhodobacter sp. SW2]